VSPEDERDPRSGEDAPRLEEMEDQGLQAEELGAGPELEEEPFRAMFEMAALGIARVQVKTGRVLRINRGYETITGYTREELLGMTFSELTHPDDRGKDWDRFQEAARQGSPYRAEKRYVRKDGSVVWVRLNVAFIPDEEGRAATTVAICEDITETRRLSQLLLQAQRLESVGRFAGGIAHDFNNMLSVILGNSELVLEQLPPESPIRTELQEIQEAAQRSAELTQQLLGFSRQQTAAPRVLDLNGTVDSGLGMLQRLIGEDIDLRWNPGDGLAPVRIDPVQLNQILSNLLVNARDAIGPDGGKVTVETGMVRLDAEYCRANPGFQEGSYTTLVVSDDGSGMDEATLEKAFDPFFSTKDPSQGTGLGLATTYGIVRQNDGFIKLYSELGSGTTARVYLPAQEEASGETVVAEESGPPPGGSETILVVEDEPAILKASGRILKRLGYTVIQASTPGEALGLAQDHQGGLDLLLTDVIMPEMSGQALVEEVKRTHPGLAFLFMSGYTADAIAHRGVLEEGFHFLQKPFSVKELAEAVRGALDDGSP